MICLLVRLQCPDPEPPCSGYDAESSAVTVGLSKVLPFPFYPRGGPDSERSTALPEDAQMTGETAVL